MQIDLVFKRQVLDMMVGKDVFAYCMQCGYCNTVCPIHQRMGSRYNPRDLVLFSLMGYKDAIVNNPDSMNVWGCTTCETCDEECPQEVPITEIINLVKNYSVELGKAPAFYQNTTKTILENGKAVPMQAAIEKRREKLGLQPSTKIAVEEIKTLMEATNATELLKAGEKPVGGAP
jgi:heterodisulfide reductase subunit C